MLSGRKFISHQWLPFKWFFHHLYFYLLSKSSCFPWISFHCRLHTSHLTHEQLSVERHVDEPFIINVLLCQICCQVRSGSVKLLTLGVSVWIMAMASLSCLYLRSNDIIRHVCAFLRMLISWNVTSSRLLS